jgi:hypothetical protein
MVEDPSLTDLIRRAQDGDAQALKSVFDVTYDDLRRLAPGLRPTLFHNNHTWEGQHPLASLFQGTGALVPGNDVGMAMDYFHLSQTAKWVAAFVALAAIVPIAARLARHLLGLSHKLFTIATVPALAALPLIVAFRMPREMLEVLLPPVLVTIVGLTAIHATAWRVRGASGALEPEPVSIAYPLVAVVALLLVFQLVLRPGIAFY